MGRNIVGSSAARAARGGSRHAADAEGRAGRRPTGRWADLAVLEPVKDYKARHASTLLVFDAVEAALARRKPGSGGGGRAGARLTVLRWPSRSNG